MTRRRKPVIARDDHGNIVARFESVKHASDYYGKPHSSVLFWIRHHSRICGGLHFEFERPEDKADAVPVSIRYTRQSNSENARLDPHFTILTYEVVNGRVSITPCPFKSHPKPMVGSSACQGCKSFRGRNRKDRQVACSNRKRN